MFRSSLEINGKSFHKLPEVFFDVKLSEVFFDVMFEHEFKRVPSPKE